MINMPKAEEARPRQVRVQVGDGSRSMDGGGSEQAAMTGQSQMTADQQQAQHDRMEQQNQQ
jgi:hypothetical protein